MNEFHAGSMDKDGAERRWKPVFTIVEQQGRGAAPERKFWIRIGTAFSNRDGSLNVRLDAVPTNGMLHIREQSPDDARGRRDEQAPRGARGLV
jgi:hypothetical protein